jgi:hypothetical protein
MPSQSRASKRARRQQDVGHGLRTRALAGVIRANAAARLAVGLAQVCLALARDGRKSVGKIPSSAFRGLKVTLTPKLGILRASKCLIRGPLIFQKT